MSEHLLEYLLPESGPEGTPLLEWLVRLRLEPGQISSTDITFLDTFDGRLYRHGKVVQVERTDGCRPNFVLRDFCERGREWRMTATSRSIPRFAQEVTDPVLRAELEPLIEVRALLPIARVRRLRQSLRRAADHEEPPADFYRDCYLLTGKRQGSMVLSPRLIVDLGESSGKQVRRSIEEWAEKSGLKCPEQDVWAELLQAQHGLSGAGFLVQPPDLQPEMRSDLAAKRILLAQFRAMRIQEPGLFARLDTEFLHDFRVAVRRSRSVLRQLRGVYPERAISAFRRDLSWLGSITGPVRDLDVYLHEFPRLEAVLPKFMRGDLEPLRSFLQRLSLAAHAALDRELKSPRYRRFTERWHSFLQRPVPLRPSAPKALEPIRRLAGRRIWKLYRRVVEEGRLIGEGASSESIHALRKRCKELRYLAEFVAPLHPEDLLTRPIKDLKKLQNLLGSFQDAAVQIGHLREWAVELAADPAVPAFTLLAVGAVIGYFDRRQRDERTQIAERVADFGRKHNRERFRLLLNGQE